jgi:hypothetical protein
MRTIKVQLTLEQIEKLARIWRYQGVCRSEAIRILVASGLKTMPDPAVLVGAVQG